MGHWDAQAVRARLHAKTFRYELRPPLPEAEVRAFEEEHGIRLPEEYGCGMYSRLILNGPLAGQVRHVDQDFGCHAPESPDFRTRYTDWLEQ